VDAVIDHTVKLSVGMPPGPDALEYARLADELGYDRIWLYDSAALYEDIWIWLARIVEHTDMKVGTAVLVPNLRHPMTTAAAIATIEGLAPGRLAVGFGTGATARWVLNKNALSWATTRRYVEQVRALLQGQVVEIEGEQCQMIHHPGWAPARPLATPLLVSAFGPKGLEQAAEMAAAGTIEGVFAMADVDVPIDWRIVMCAGTVMEAGEAITDERVKQALGPWYVVRYHGIWQMFPEGVAGMPEGEAWLAGVEAERPEGQRHLAVHEGHVTDVMPRDRAALDAAGDALATTGWVGTREELRARAHAADAAGTREILFTPAGNVEREMRAFAEAILG
jgi:5,10-methylenetetrahydromethanopterin reductase